MKLLLPLAWIYGGVMAVRNWMFNHGIYTQSSFPLPLISIGNLAVGGTGKTPHTEYLLALLTKENLLCGMLSRGYGRQTKGYYEAKGHSPQQVGDEPWQVQHKFPQVRVCVCEKRVIGVQNMLQSTPPPDVILLDDAYQHRYVKPGLSILLTDFSRPYYSDDVMPAGRLREFRSGAKRANLILVTKCPKNLSAEKQEVIKQRLAPLAHQQVFFTYFDYGRLYAFEGANQETQETQDLSTERILLLCGIARPENLITYLQSKCKEVELAKFPDHHNFSTTEIEQLSKRASHFDKVVTTEKDAARLSGYNLSDSFRKKLWIQPIEVKFLNNESNQFNKIIVNYVTENSRNR